MSLCLFLSIFLGAENVATANKTGLPLPRFVSLRADKVHFRTGPGLQYPIEWVYQKQSMPVEIIAEFETWRKVRDWQNTEGWVHQSTLSKKRMLIIVGSIQEILKYNKLGSPIVAEAEPGVIGKLLSCKANQSWCEVEINRYEGWLQRNQFWGVNPKELIE